MCTVTDLIADRVGTILALIKSKQGAEMIRLYGKVEQSVMDEKILQEAVEEQGPKEEAGQISKEEGISFNAVLQLRLEYKSK